MKNEKKNYFFVCCQNSCFFSVSQRLCVFVLSFSFSVCLFVCLFVHVCLSPSVSVFIRLFLSVCLWLSMSIFDCIFFFSLSLSISYNLPHFNPPMVAFFSFLCFFLSFFHFRLFVLFVFVYFVVFFLFLNFFLFSAAFLMWKKEIKKGKK